MEQLINYINSKGLRTASLPLLDTPVYYGVLDDFDITFLINPWGLPELVISTAIPQRENEKSLSAIHPLFGTPLLSPDATDPFVQLFVSHFLAVFLLICIWIAEIVIDVSNKKSGLSGIIKLK